MIRHIASAIAISALIFTLPAMAQDQQKGQLAFSLNGAGVHQSETDLSDGIDTFTWTDPVYADAGVWRFMPSSPPYTISEIGGDLYDLTFKVMRVPS